MRCLELELLGGFRITVDGQPLDEAAWAHRRAMQLAKLLALTPGHRLHREQALDALWPALAPNAAAANLHKAASYARKALGAADALVLRHEHVSLAPAAEIWVDAERFEAEATAALHSDDAERCRRAALLYAGELLPDERYEDWAATPRDRLRSLLLQLLRRAEQWEQLLVHEPLDEEGHRALMQRYSENGNRIAALYQFGHLRELLRRELDLEPDPATVALYRQLSLGPPDPPPLVPPPIRYRRSGDINVAYQIVGDAPRDILMIPGWVSHLALDWEEPLWVQWCERMTVFARLIRFDKRGTGLSDRPAGVPTLEERMEDAHAVLDAAGSERAHVFGWSEGGPLGIALAARHSERVQSLVLYGTQARFVRDADYPWGPTFEEWQRSLREIEEGWGTYDAAAYFAPAGDRRFAQQFAAYLRAGASPSAAAALQRANHLLDVRSLLGEIKVPTLVLSRTGDPVGPPEPARYLADGVPGARFIELPGDNHLPWVGDSAAVCAEIEAFVCQLDRAGKVSGRVVS